MGIEVEVEASGAVEAAEVAATGAVEGGSIGWSFFFFFRVGSRTVCKHDVVASVRCSGLIERQALTDSSAARAVSSTAIFLPLSFLFFFFFGDS